MKAIVLKAPSVYGMEEVDIPQPKDGEVLIRVMMAGICGTDLHVFKGRNPFVTYPLIPGHEYVGEVLSPPKASRFKAGDKVTVFPGKGCGSCEACRAGRIPHCPHFQFIGTSLSGGGFAEYVTADLDRLFPLPDTLDIRGGTMVEPVAVAVHANRRVGLLGHQAGGEKVVVIGGGTIGLLVALVARLSGASPILISEPIKERRTLAEKLGFTLTCDPATTDPVAFAREKMGLADVVFDVVGAEPTLLAAQNMLRPGAILALVAAPSRKGMAVPYELMFKKELTAIGTRTYFMEDFKEAVDMLSTGRLDVSSFLSGVLPLSQFQEGLRRLEEEPEKNVKILLDPMA